MLAGESVWSIGTDWNDQGVPTVTGRPWTVQTITSILTSGGSPASGNTRAWSSPKGQWKRIIDEDLPRAPPRCAGTEAQAPQGRTYPLVGFLLCGKCGAPLRSLARENGGRSYACRKGPGMGGCGGIRIQANGLEHYIRDLICGMLADPETRGALAALAETDDGESSLVEDLRAVEAKRQRLIDLYTEGDIERADFRTRRDELDEEARAIESQMAQRSGNRVFAEIPATFEELVEVWEERGPEFQRRLAKALLHPITVKPVGRQRKFNPDRLVVEPGAEADATRLAGAIRA